MASLTDYNNGGCTASGSTPSQEPDELHAAVQHLLRNSYFPDAEEWTIFDYEGLGDLKLGEYESLETVNKIAKGIEEHGQTFTTWVSYVGAEHHKQLDRFEDQYRGEWESADLEDSVENVALSVLRGSIEALDATPDRTVVQDLWLEDAHAMADELTRHEALGSRAADFVELVKRGANLTYCTTSAGELEALTADQSFDWSIVEEAGKAHGFDLALPLQAGHRWLLIGDHEQLPPYRFEDYRAGIDNLDLVVESLQRLPQNASGLLDWEWVAAWRERPSAARREFIDYAHDWLKTFKQVFAHCSVAVGGGDAGEKITTERSGGAAAGMLVGQHRMHPDIGELISRAYYDEKLVNRTVDTDGIPIARVQHGYSAPDGIAGKAIVWVDLPWCRNDPRTHERGPRITRTTSPISGNQPCSSPRGSSVTLLTRRKSRNSYLVVPENGSVGSDQSPSPVRTGTSCP